MQLAVPIMFTESTGTSAASDMSVCATIVDISHRRSWKREWRSGLVGANKGRARCRAVPCALSPLPLPTTVAESEALMFSLSSKWLL